MKQPNNRRGFTIVEVTLAMTFLSVLLITVAFLTIHVTSIYQKGLSIKAITSTGRELIDEFSRSISSSAGIEAEAYCSGFTDARAQEACYSDHGRSFIYQVRYATVTENSETNPFKVAFSRSNAERIPVSGIFCSGRYSYLWNSGYVLNDSNPDAKQYSAILERGEGSEKTTYENFRLLKIVDVGRSLCAAHLSDLGSYQYDNVIASTASDNRTYSAVNIGTIEEVLTNSEDNLALYSLDIFEPTTHAITKHSFYSGTFILATVQGGIDITAQGDYCTEDPTLNFDTDFNYCAINKFNFAMRATGETKS